MKTREYIKAFQTNKTIFPTAKQVKNEAEHKNERN